MSKRRSRLALHFHSDLITSLVIDDYSSHFLILWGAIVLHNLFLHYHRVFAGQEHLTVFLKSQYFDKPSQSLALPTAKSLNLHFTSS